MSVLVVNSGSSSVKYELFGEDPLRSLSSGEIGRQANAFDPGQGFAAVLDGVASSVAGAGIADITVVGHRVVHGGSRFTEPTLLDDVAIEGIRGLALLAPLHTAANLAGIEAARAQLPGVPQVAVFDSAFHRELPARAREYALPREMARAHGIRRYGFHGTSFAFVSRRASIVLGKPLGTLDMIVLHLGNGASACAIKGGKSIDTSMGMTPLEGLVMGTRCGDVDPAVPLLIREVTGLEREDVHRLLNHESGLLGLCGASDMREVHRLITEGDSDAEEALDIFCYRAAKYVGAYVVALGRLDALVFTGGIGENDAEVRSRICDSLGVLGIGLDEGKNRAASNAEREIQGNRSRVSVLVVPTDEEAEIARLALACVKQNRS